MEQRWHTLTKTLGQAFISWSECACHVGCYLTPFQAWSWNVDLLLLRQMWEALSHAVLACKHVCVQASGALGASGLADRCIIFGRVAPSLWRASLKSAGSLCLPLSGSGTSAKQVRWLLQHTARWNRGLCTAQDIQRCAAHRWLERLLAVERYIFTGVKQVDRGFPSPLWKQTLR